MEHRNCVRTELDWRLCLCLGTRGKLAASGGEPDPSTRPMSWNRNSDAAYDPRPQSMRWIVLVAVGLSLERFFVDFSLDELVSGLGERVHPANGGAGE